MIVVPVIDLKGGVVVRGVAGRRGEYRPIVSRIAREPTPRAVAEVFAQRFGFRQTYIADLDAIHGRPANFAVYHEIAACGLRPWIDAGVGTVEQALQLIELEASIIVGLESLASPEELPKIVAACGAGRVVFSLDLKTGRPITKVAAWQNTSPDVIASFAAAAGIGRLIVLDLADVGVGGGTGTLGLVRKLRSAHPQLEITAGGGVRGIADLRKLADAGCAAALVASALHDGQIASEEIQCLTSQVDLL